MSDNPTSSPDRAAALEAAQRRARAAQEAATQGGSSGSLPIPPDVRISHLKIINDQVLDKNKRPEAMDALRLIVTLLTNAQHDETKRSIRLSNATIKRRLVDVKGATDYLLVCCWAPKTVNFEPHLVYPATPNERQAQALDFGLRILTERMSVLEERFSKSQEAAHLHKLEEDARVGRAMAEFREDREKNKLRAEREKQAREAQAEKERLDAEREKREAEQSHLDARAKEDNDDMPGGMSLEQAAQEDSSKQ